MENNNLKRSSKHINLTNETKKHFTRLQKIIAFIGSILGLITASITIYNFSNLKNNSVSSTASTSSTTPSKEVIVEKTIIKEDSSKDDNYKTEDKSSIPSSSIETNSHDTIEKDNKSMKNLHILLVIHNLKIKVMIIKKLIQNQIKVKKFQQIKKILLIQILKMKKET